MYDFNYLSERPYISISISIYTELLCISNHYTNDISFAKIRMAEGEMVIHYI